MYKLKNKLWLFKQAKIELNLLFFYYTILNANLFALHYENSKRQFYCFLVIVLALFCE